MKKILLLMAIAIIGFTSCTTIDSGSIGVKFYKWSSDETEKGGVRFSYSTVGSVIGKHASILLDDDRMDSQIAISPAHRKRAMRR